MSKSTKVYTGAVLILIVFPAVLGLWFGSAAAIMAIALLGIGGYGFAVCLLIAGFWHRFRYGAWPGDIEEESPDRRLREAAAALGAERPLLYRVNQLLLGWLNRHFSNV